MMLQRSWAAYPASYRAKEMQIVAQWIAAGESGVVVGLAGSGKSNLLGFLAHRPDVLRSYLPSPARSAVLIPVDLNNLPANDLATIYRVLLRSFYRVRDRFELSLQQHISHFYQENRLAQDPFLPQSALQELLEIFRSRQIRIVFVLNRFDQFCRRATPYKINTLRGLRDDFKETLCFIVSMTQAVTYFPDPAILGDMYELLDHYVCWVGAMQDADARNLIAQATQAAPIAPTKTDMTTMLALTGNYPALLRATCYWWLTTPDKPPHAGWQAALLAQDCIRHRLEKIWAGLTQEERFTLARLQVLQVVSAGVMVTNGSSVHYQPKGGGQSLADFSEKQQDVLAGLAAKGVCVQTNTGWRVAGDLLAAYVAEVKGRSRGRVWLDVPTGDTYQGSTLLTQLTTLERSVLAYLIQHPRVRHTKTDLIVNTWPDELRREGVTDNSLYQVIFAIRQAIEPNPTEPAYLLTWRGKPEGGYQFFPEGRPG
jgi:hypothetical protein